MLQQHALLVAASALGASAQSFSHTFTGSRGAAIDCTQVLHEELPKLTGIPEPDEEAFEAAQELFWGFIRGSVSNEDDNCDLPDVGGPQASAFSDWATSYTSWRDAQLTIYQEIYSACSDVPDSDDIPTSSGICSTFVAKITGGPVPDREGGDGDGSNGNNGDGDGDNSGSQLSGMGLWAAAGAGILVIAIAL